MASYYLQSFHRRNYNSYVVLNKLFRISQLCTQSIDQSLSLSIQKVFKNLISYVLIKMLCQKLSMKFNFQTTFVELPVGKTAKTKK